MFRTDEVLLERTEREKLEKELRALIHAYKAFKCEREGLLASIRRRRAGLLERNLGKVIASVERDLMDTFSEICRVSNRLLQVAAVTDGQARAQE